MKIATFNVNSIRVRLDLVLDWLAVNEPDVLAIQETKCEDASFPAEAFEDCGYHVAYHGMKTYNGVAIASREPGIGVVKGLPGTEDCRLLAAHVGGVHVINTYVPNGTRVGSEKFDYKIEWLARFTEFVRGRFSPDDPVVWLGDINIAPTADDVYDSPKMLGGVGHHPREFEALARVVDWGWQDVFRRFTEGGGHYTFWDYVIPRSFERNLGWRIDHIYASPGMAGRCRSCAIDLEPRRAEKPSDHTVVVAEFA